MDINKTSISPRDKKNLDNIDNNFILNKNLLFNGE